MDYTKAICATMQARLFSSFILLAVILTGCRSPQFGGGLSVTVTADGSESRLEVQSGTTVAQALQQAGRLGADHRKARHPIENGLRTWCFLDPQRPSQETQDA